MKLTSDQIVEEIGRRVIDESVPSISHALGSLREWIRNEEARRTEAANHLKTPVGTLDVGKTYNIRIKRNLYPSAERKTSPEQVLAGWTVQGFEKSWSSQYISLFRKSGRWGASRRTISVDDILEFTEVTE